MEKKEEMYTNLCISIHNLDISLNENVQKLIAEVVSSVYKKVSNTIKEKYKNVLFDEQLMDIIKQNFEQEKNKYLLKYDSITLENMNSEESYSKYLDEQEEKVKYDKEEISLLISNIQNSIDEYLKSINSRSLFYQRDVVKINEDINKILLKEIESYFLKTSKLNILAKSASEKVYSDIMKNYSIEREIVGKAR